MLVTHTTEPAPCRPHLVLSDSLKGVRETLCVAQAALYKLPLGYSAGGSIEHHRDVLGRLIAEIDRQRPLGPDGKHGELHTETCGCERPGLHCVHWHDGDNCCRCGDPRDPGVCQGCGSSDCEGCGGPDDSRTVAWAVYGMPVPPVAPTAEAARALTDGPAPGTVFNCRCDMIPPDLEARTAMQMELADLRYQCRATPGETTLTVNADAQLKAWLIARFGSLELAGVHYGIMIQDGYGPMRHEA